jgi:hypothetical protein
MPRANKFRLCFHGGPALPRRLNRGFRRVPAKGRRAVFRTEMRSHLVSHFIQQLFAGNGGALGGMSALIVVLRAPRLTHRTIGCRLPLRTCRAFAAIASYCLPGSNGPLQRVSACLAPSLPWNVATQRRVVSSEAILRRRQACRLVSARNIRDGGSHGLLHYCIAWQQLTSIALHKVRSRHRR